MANEHIRVFDLEDVEYKKLNIVCELLGILMENENFHLSVRDTYYDYGMDWQWSTILATRLVDSHLDTWQFLTPKQQKRIIDASLEELYLCAYEIAKENERMVV